jgi:hypothetical protein
MGIPFIESNAKPSIGLAEDASVNSFRGQFPDSTGAAECLSRETASNNAPYEPSDNFQVFAVSNDFLCEDRSLPQTFKDSTQKSESAM